MRLLLAALGACARRGAAELGDALYPPLCWLCRERPVVDGLGCAQHALAAARFAPEEPRCSGCALRLPEGIHEGLCALCRRRPRGYRRLIAAGPYRNPALREWILAFKHGSRPDLARPLASFLAARFESQAGAAWGSLLVSVPLHPMRRLERGYDQARLLGEELAAALRLPHLCPLRRSRWTSPQGGPGGRSRASNVAGAFEARRRSAAQVAGRSIWLVDDVVTSGATVRACAEVLRRAGAAEVSVVALARAELGRREEDGPGCDRRSTREEEEGAGSS